MFQYKKSYIFFLFLVFFNSVASWPKRRKNNNDIQRLIELIKRRNILESDENILDVPESLEDLPSAEPIQPGHTLLQPSQGMLASSAKYPHKNTDKTAVYGNMDNLGLTYGKTNARVLYTGFRKANDVLMKLLQALNKKSNILPKNSTDLVIIELDPSIMKNIGNEHADVSAEDKNVDNAIEILDDPKSYEESQYTRTRRQRHPRRSKYRERISTESKKRKSDSSSSDSDSTDYEHNPGNPYTLYKSKYKQNWLWNHFMDGNHMNVNPYAPPLNSMGPTGAQLFFGRKWWYFNQDDFNPLH